jgi:phage-related protein
MADYNLGTASGRIVVDGSGASKGFNVARRSAGAFFDVVKMRIDGVTALGRRMAVTGGTSVAAFGAMIKTAANFQQAMSGVYAVANATEKQQEQLRQKAIQLGKDTVFSASEAANALEELVKAGVPVEDILNGAADAAVALAAAGGVSIPEAATIAANAMNQFGLKGKQVTGIADILAGVANTSAADVTTLGTSLQQTGAVANLAGLSFRDTAVALGEMADAGVGGSDAGTSLKQMLLNLIPTTDKQVSTMEDLGLITTNLKKANQALVKEGLKPTAKSYAEAENRLRDYVARTTGAQKGSLKVKTEVQKLMYATGGMSNQLFDAAGNVKNLRSLQDILFKSTKNLTRQQKLNAFQIIFGSDSMRAAAILAGKGAKGYDKFSESVAKTKAADVAKKRLDNLDGAVQQFQGSMETVAITIGTVFLPMVTKIVNGVTAILNAFIGLPHGVQVAIAIFGLLLSSGTLLIGLFLAFLPVIAGFLVHMLALRAIGTVVSGFRLFYAELRAGTGVLAATQLGMARTATEVKTLGLRTLFTGRLMVGFGKAMLFVGKALKAALLNPYVIALLALVAVGILLYKKWKPFHDLVDKIAAALKGYLLEAWAALKRGVADALKVLQQFGDWVKSVLLPVLEQVGGKIVRQLVQAWSQIKTAIVSQLLPAFQQMIGSFNQAKDTVNKDVVPALQRLWQHVEPVVQAIGHFASVVGGKLLSVLITVGKFIITTILPILIKLFGVFAGIGIKAILNFALGIIQALTGVFQIIGGFIKLVDDIFHGRWGKVWQDALQILKGFGNLLGGLFRDALAIPIALIQSFGGKIVNAFKSMIGGLFGGSGGGGGGAGPLHFIPAFFEAAFKLVVTIVTTYLDIVKGIITGVLTVVKGIWDAYWGLFGPVVKAVFGLIAAIIELFWVIVKGVFLLGLMFIFGLVKAVFGFIAKRIKADMNTIVTIVRAVWGAIKSVFQTVMGFIKSFIAREWRGLSRIFGPPLRAVLGIVKAVFGTIKNFVTSRIRAVVGVVRSSSNAIKDVFSSVWRSLSGIVSSAWGRVTSAVSKGIGHVKTAMGKVKDAVTGPLKDFATDMFNAGAALIQKLIDGIGSKINAVTDKIHSLTNKVKGFLPGSPIKTGPLVSWNDGGAGKRLIGLLAKGMEDTKPVDNAIKSLARFVNKQALDLTPVIDAQPTILAGGPGRSTRPALATTHPSTARTRQRPNGDGGGGVPRSRILDGKLRIDEDGVAFFEGIAEDVVDDHERHNGSRGRQ